MRHAPPTGSRATRRRSKPTAAAQVVAPRLLRASLATTRTNLAALVVASSTDSSSRPRIAAAEGRALWACAPPAPGRGRPMRRSRPSTVQLTWSRVADQRCGSAPRRQPARSAAASGGSTGCSASNRSFGQSGGEVRGRGMPGRATFPGGTGRRGPAAEAGGSLSSSGPRRGAGSDAASARRARAPWDEAMTRGGWADGARTLVANDSEEGAARPSRLAKACRACVVGALRERTPAPGRRGRAPAPATPRRRACEAPPAPASWRGLLRAVAPRHRERLRRRAARPPWPARGGRGRTRHLRHRRRGGLLFADGILRRGGIDLGGDRAGPRVVAGELGRVASGGGRLGLAAWEPGRAALDVHRDAPEHGPSAQGAGNPFDWGRPSTWRRCSATPSPWSSARGGAPRWGPRPGCGS